ncbi:uncharacterized protein EKO05_0010274 [Ascochyta rabiei]|uniref:uncharacterized protein n=1 Tax=Didymella rabiei TaxID=5454 RepID=UPI0019008179|nr:uncharacterized protein EKO05_0010274 [Ascochyta rabiei]UPX20028.1 hypothetical protein EKO05_0010274 [Ascochyta rabiei]
MYFRSLLGLAAAASAVVVAAQQDAPPRLELDWALTPDKTADWYKDHKKPVPEFAPEITVVEEKNSYVVKLDCSDCPFLVKKSFVESSWQKQENSLLLKFDVKDALSQPSPIPTLHINGFPVLPLGAMPLYINAHQVAANLTQETMNNMVRERLLDPDFGWQTKYHKFPLQYEHVLLRTETPGQWWMQFDVTGLQYGADGEPVHFGENHKLVQILVKHVKSTEDSDEKLSIEDIQVVETAQRVQAIRMKCGKLAMVKTLFDPNEWDEYGKLGSWSREWNMVFGKIGQYWEDHIQHNALLMPVALLLAFFIFFVRVWYQKRQQEKTMDAEYALLESAHDDLPPAYSDIPIIKIEEYD